VLWYVCFRLLLACYLVLILYIILCYVIERRILAPRPLPSGVQQWIEEGWGQWMIFPGWGQWFEFCSVLWFCYLGDRKDIWPIKHLCHFSQRFFLEHLVEENQWGNKLNHVHTGKRPLKWRLWRTVVHVFEPNHFWLYFFNNFRWFLSTFFVKCSCWFLRLLFFIYWAASQN